MAPACFLIARIDLPGGSSGGYHRAAIIEAAISHFREWWFAGTNWTLTNLTVPLLSKARPRPKCANHSGLPAQSPFALLTGAPNRRVI
jgi:hypothetical protein